MSFEVVVCTIKDENINSMSVLKTVVELEVGGKRRRKKHKSEVKDIRDKRNK